MNPDEKQSAIEKQRAAELREADADIATKQEAIRALLMNLLGPMVQEVNEGIAKLEARVAALEPDAS